MPTHPYLDLQQGNVESYCMMVSKGGATHVPEFVCQDGRIPPHGSEARSAYESGSIADYLMFQHKDAWLVV